MSVDFVSQDTLWLLLSLFPIALLLRLFENLRLNRTKLLSNPSTKLSLKFNSWSLLPLIVIALIITAIARPFNGSETIEIPGAVKDVLILQDISKSMLATDLKPSRLEFSKRKLQDIVKYSAANLPNSRIGLVLFSGESYLYCPLTEDYGVLDYFIKSISVDLITSQGTAIDDAIATAAKSLEEVKSKEAAVILITDGEDNRLNTATTIDYAKRFGMKMNVIATGTVEGSPIPERQGNFLKDNSGNIVISKLAESSLKEIAEESGGIYQAASLTNSDITTILGSGLKENTNYKSNKTFTLYNELAHYFIMGSLLILITCAILKKENLVFLFLFFICRIDNAFCEDAVPDLNASYQAYKNNDFQTAQKGFEYYHKKYPNDIKISQSLASSLYKLGKFKEAEVLFNQIYESTKNGKEKFEALYNSGNASFMQNDFKSAIKDYEEALLIKPGDENSEYNLNLAKLKLEEENKAKPSPTPTPPANQNQKSEKQKQDENQQSEEEKQDQEQESQDQKQNENQQSDQQKQEANQESKNNESEKKDENQDTQDEDSKKDQQDKEKQNEQDQGKDQKEQKDFQKDGEEEKLEGEAQPISEEKMKENEAKAWLESLADTPVLLRRKVSKPSNRNKQQW